MKSLKQLLNAKGHHVHSIRPDAKVIEALQLMAQKDIGALLVTDAGRSAFESWSVSLASGDSGFAGTCCRPCVLTRRGGTHSVGV